MSANTQKFYVLVAKIMTEVIEVSAENLGEAKKLTKDIKGVCQVLEASDDLETFRDKKVFLRNYR
jgi:hypothetical protein